MSLAYATVSADTVDYILHHLHTGSRGYGNMHLRKTRQVKGEQRLRYLHAIIADGPAAAEGALSGPKIFVRYRLTRNRLVLTKNIAPQGDHERLQQRFFEELVSRVDEEKANTNEHAPNYLPGRFYLRRGRPGSLATSPSCAAALTLQMLDPAFVSLLSPWNLKLLHRQ